MCGQNRCIDFVLVFYILFNITVQQWRKEKSKISVLAEDSFEEVVKEVGEDTIDSTRGNIQREIDIFFL